MDTWWPVQVKPTSVYLFFFLPGFRLFHFAATLDTGGLLMGFSASNHFSLKEDDYLT